MSDWLFIPMEMPGGYWKMVATDSQASGPFSLCSCLGGHKSAEEAISCKQAKTRKKYYEPKASV